MDPLKVLPCELARHIVSFVDSETLQSLSCCSKRWLEEFHEDNWKANLKLTLRIDSCGLRGDSVSMTYTGVDVLDQLHFELGGGPFDVHIGDWGDCYNLSFDNDTELGSLLYDNPYRGMPVGEYYERFRMNSMGTGGLQQHVFDNGIEVTYTAEEIVGDDHESDDSDDGMRANIGSFRVKVPVVVMKGWLRVAEPKWRREKRKQELQELLGEVGLQLRNDSKLCDEYIELGRGEPTRIVEVMQQMDFLHGKTTYTKRLKKRSNRQDIEGLKRRCVREYAKSHPDDDLPAFMDAYAREDEELEEFMWKL